jgi:hypothetical protein
MDIEKKFIFTDEGRNLLISQEGGIRFAVLGGLLIQGLTPKENLEDFYDTYRHLTLETLLEGGTLGNIELDGVMLGLRGIDYVSRGNGNVAPSDEDAYNAALNEIQNHLYGTFYMPNRELQSDSGSHYGTYEFSFEASDFAWDRVNDVSFGMIALIGKQYAETNDAVFNVDNTQKPVIVGLAQLPGSYDGMVFDGGVQFLAEREDFTAFKLQIQFTLTDQDTENASITDENYREMTAKMSIVNDGLKTMEDIHIVDTNQPSQTLAALNANLESNPDVDLYVGGNGSMATSRTLMIADPYNATEVENQWNAAAQMHIVNKKVNIPKTEDGVSIDNMMYKEQIVLTTLEEPSSLSNESLSAYYAGIMLRGSGNEISGYTNMGAGPSVIPVMPPDLETHAQITAFTAEYQGNIPDFTATSAIYYSGVEGPVFRQCAVPEYDTYAVDIFGIENKILDSNNLDKFIFSQRNVTLNPAGLDEYGYDEDDAVNYGYNVVIDSDENYMNGNTNNTFIRSNGNFLFDNSNCNLMIGSDKNLFTSGANTNIVFGSDFNIFTDENTQRNIVIGGQENYIDGASNCIYFGGTGLKSFGNPDMLLMGKFNAMTDAAWVYGNGSDILHRHNAFELYPDAGELKLYTPKGDVSITLGGTKGIELGTSQILRANRAHIDQIKVRDITLTTDLESSNAQTAGIRSMGNYTDLWMQNIPNSTDTTRHSLKYNESNNGIFTLYSELLSTYTKNEYVNIQAGHSEFFVNSNNHKYYTLINMSMDATNTPVVANDSRIELVDQYGTLAKNIITPDSIRLVNGSTESVLNAEKIQQYDTVVNGNYVKACADIFVWGSSKTDWQVGVKRFNGSENVKTWLKNIFQNAPPIIYSNTGAPNYTNGFYYCYKPSDATYTDVLVDASDFTALTTFTSRTNNNGNGGTDSALRRDDDTIALRSLVPQTFGLDELEINLYVHSFGLCAFIWEPYVANSSQKVPKISVTIRNDESNSTMGLYVYRNTDYTTTGNPQFKEYLRDNEIPLKLTMTPQALDIPVTESNPIGWWVDNGFVS